MKKHTSEEAFYERVRHLANVNKTSIKESQNRTLGTLIDVKRAADGVAYGIIKEQHHYYIKKGGLKDNPSVADFAYIGGLANITEFQYGKLSEAEKQRNMLFNTINEGISTRVSKTGSKISGKKRLNEDLAGKEIENAEEKLGDLDAATAASEVPAEPAMGDGEAEMAAGVEDMPVGDMGGEELPAEEPAPEGGEEMPDMGGEEETPDMGGEELPAEDDVTGGEEVAVEDPESETTREIEKSLGKLTNKLRKTDLTDSQVKSYVNSFLSAFKDKFPDVDIEDRKTMAEKITKVVPPEDIEDLGQNVEDTEDAGGLPEPEKEMAEQQCAECGGFAQYAESRGYTAESLMECGGEEMANVVSGYANAHSEGQNDGDFKAVALFITPEIIEKLKGDYGHDEYADQLTPYTNELSEATEEDKMAQINELFGGLGSMAKDAWGGIKKGGQAVGGAVKGAGQAVAGAAQKGAQAVKSAGQQVGQAVGQAGTAVKQSYYKGEKNAALGKLEQIAADLGKQIAAVNSNATKAGQEPINVNSILMTIKNQVGAGGAANLGKFRTNEEGMPVDSVEVQPSMAGLEEDVTLHVGEKKGKALSPKGVPTKEMKESEEVEGDDVEEVDIDNLDVDDEGGEKEGNFFANDTQALGGGVVKPSGAPTTTVEVTKGNVNVTLSEAKGLNKIPFTKGAKIVKEEKPSAGLSAEKKSSVVKKAKAGEDIGKKGKGFDKLADKAAKEYGSKEAGEKVAGAAMWKNIKEGDEKEEISESEQKLRKYIRRRLEENSGLKKPMLTENKKSDTLKKLDATIDKQFKLFESTIIKKKENLNEILGFSIKEKFAKLDPNDGAGVSKLFMEAFNNILTNPNMGAIARVARKLQLPVLYNLLKQYVEGGGGTLRLTADGASLQYMPKDFQNQAIPSEFHGGGTQGRTQMGGV